MAIPKMSGVSLLTAIRQFSDPVDWAVFELLLGLKGGDAEARAGWTEEEWALHDSQVKLKLEAARHRLIVGPPGLHLWDQLKTAFRTRLRSGELVATGYVKPRKLNDSRTAIPADKWQFLVLDFSNGTASGDGLEVVEILIDRAEHASEHETEPEGMGEHIPLGVTPKEKPEPAPDRRFSEAAVRNWYEQYVKDHADDERPPSRDDDLAAVRKEYGDGVPRDTMRALRRDLAPAKWKKAGPPKTGGR